MASNQLQSDPTSAPKDPSFPDPLDPSFTVDVKHKFATYFAPQFNLCPSERYCFMNAQSYITQMCVDPPDEKKQYLEWKDPYKKLNYPDELGDIRGPVTLFPVDKNGDIQSDAKGRLYTHFQIEEDTNNEMIRLVYSAFYPFNGFQPVQVECKNPKNSFYFELSPMGRHVGDWEHVTVFIKYNPDINSYLGTETPLISRTDPNNWELYCVYGSQHGDYAVGFPKKYYDMYNDPSSYFKQEFIATQPQQQAPKVVSQIELKQPDNDDNGPTCMIYVSFNTHANQFTKDRFVHFQFPFNELKKLYKEINNGKDEKDNTKVAADGKNDSGTNITKDLVHYNIEYINFVDSTTYGQEDGVLYYSFGGDKYKTMDKHTLGSESVTLILNENGVNYEVNGERLSWDVVGQGFRWGPPKHDKLANLTCPVDTVNDALGLDLILPSHGAIESIIKLIAAVVGSDKAIKNYLQLRTQGPQAPIYIDTKKGRSTWWLDREPCPYKTYGGVYAVKDSKDSKGSKQRIELRPLPMSHGFTIAPLGKINDYLSISSSSDFDWSVGSGSFLSKMLVLFNKNDGIPNTYTFTFDQDEYNTKIITLNNGDVWTKQLFVDEVVSDVVNGVASEIESVVTQKE